MPPTDNNVPAPNTPKPGFFAKLFRKKAPVTPVVPPAESHTPPPQLDDPSGLAATDTSSTPVTSPVSEEPASTPVAGAGVVSPQVDSVTGAPQPPVESSPDPSGDVTVPSLDVPHNVADTTEGETPTLPVQPQPGVQSPEETPSSAPNEDPAQKF